MNLWKALFASAPRMAPQDCTDRVRDGRALVIDVREPEEWRSGIVQGAALLPLSDLKGPRTQWRPFLTAASGCELICYCAAGGRAGAAAKLLETEGFAASNGGGIAAWAEAGWPIVPPEAAKS